MCVKERQNVLILDSALQMVLLCNLIWFYVVKSKKISTLVRDLSCISVVPVRQTQPGDFLTLLLESWTWYPY